MINDEQVRGLRRALGAVERAGAARAFDARLAGAGVVLRRNFQPDLAFGIAVEVKLVAVA